MASDCKVVKIRGRRRRLCWGNKRIGAHTQRVIISNRPASGSSKPTKRKASKRRKSSAKRRTTKSGKVTYVFTSRANAVRKSGPKKGKLKKGCKFTRSGGAMCQKSKR